MGSCPPEHATTLCIWRMQTLFSLAVPCSPFPNCMAMLASRVHVQGLSQAAQKALGTSDGASWPSSMEGLMPGPPPVAHVMRRSSNKSLKKEGTDTNLTLDALFEHLKAAGIAQGGDEELDALTEGSFIALAEMFGLDFDDPVLLIIPFKLHCTATFRITREQWMEGWRAMGAKHQSHIKQVLPKLRQEVMDVHAEVYKQFYSFTFSYIKDGAQRSMDCLSAVDTWRVLLKGQCQYLEEWCDFVADHYKRPINSDQWAQFLLFVQTHPTAPFHHYDIDSAWPVLIDEFVEHMQKRRESVRDSGRTANSET